ncbi:MAG TPA: Gldg family protein [Spirochaetales bacterium]|nr:Gldg family protein [Spirochaetales bacterium]
MDTRKRRQRVLVWLSLLACVLAACASSLYWFRADVSSGKAYTLSSAARTLYDEIPEQVRITYFISPSLSDRHPGPGAIKDLLGELAAVSRGRIAFRSVDPSKDPSQADAFGVEPQQMQVVEKSEQRVALVYTGIVIEYLDRYHTIPAIIDTATLEYETIKAVRALVRNRTQKAGLLLGDADKTVENDYRYLASSLERAGYAVSQVQRGTDIPPDISVLLVLGNAALDRYDSWLVDSYLMRGGRVLFAVKGVDIQTAYGLNAKALPAGGFLGALESYGFVVQRELVLDRQNLTVPFQSASPSGAASISYVRYPHWIALDARYANKDHPISTRFAGLDLYWPSPLELIQKPGLVYTELYKTSPGAWKQTKELVTGPEYSSMYEQEQGLTTGQYLVAASASGSFPSAFANGDLPSRDGMPALAPGLKASPDTRVVVFSCADFLTDLMEMSQSGFNASVAVAATDWLSSEDDLIAIRSRAAIDPRLNRIDEPGTRSAMIALTYAVNLFLVPVAVIAFGVLRAWKKKRLESSARKEGRSGGEA